MAYQQHAARYLENEILSRPKEWLVPLLYEHLVKHLRRLDQAIQTGNVALQAQASTKASDILYELLGTLDHGPAPHISKPLASLYAFLIAELLRITRSKDTRALGRVIGITSGLLEAWTKAAEQVAPKGAKPALSLV